MSLLSLQTVQARLGKAIVLDGVSLSPAIWLPAAGGIGATAGLHLWRRSIGLSLIGGTGVYVALSLLLG